MVLFCVLKQDTLILLSTGKPRKTRPHKIEKKNVDWDVKNRINKKNKI